MQTASLDQLFAIAEASPLLDEAEQALRDMGQTTAANDLLKLQQDAGVQIDREMTGYDPDAPSPGPESARLNATFTPVTPARFDMLRGAQALLPEGPARSGLGTLMTSLGIEAKPADTPARGRSPAP